MKLRLLSLQPLQAVFVGTMGLTIMFVTGCSDTASTPPGNAITDSPPEMDSHEEHDHPTEGPHHGDLVELGNDEYHAEVVHGEGGRVTIHILDSAAKAAVPIDATDLSINIAHDNQEPQT